MAPSDKSQESSSTLDPDFGRALGLVVAIFSAATGLSEGELLAHKNFEEFGVDSFMIQKLNTSLREAFGSLSNTLLFEHQTIRELTGFLLQTRREAFPALQSSSSTSSTPARLEGPALTARPPTEKRDAAPTSRSSEAAAPRRSVRLPPSTQRASTPPARSSAADSSEVAIIGFAGQYPQSPNSAALWQKLLEGQSLIETVPSERWNADDYYTEGAPRPGRAYAKWGGFVPGVKSFDPAFFKVTPRDAELMDPQERKFLEVVWQLFDQSGYTRARLKAEHQANVGVYVGAFFGHYELWGVSEYARGATEVPSSSLSLIANRVSYFFGLQGPSVALDTMCSSSLTALHLACQSLRSGECELAVAGGVNLILHPQKYLYLCQSRFLATDGRCRSFGANGSGYVPGEGVGALLLKPLSAALRDGDPIHATILGSSINHAGRGGGFTVPNVPAQEKVVREALRRAGVDASEVDYIEAHGTGTVLGDPVEVDALRRVYGQAARRDRIPIGSVKSNIGHLESAAGVASITKVLLQMKHLTLVPSLHAEPENPLLELEHSPFRVQKQLAPWERVAGGAGDVRIAAVSSFGAGGSNAHVILKSFKAGRKPAGDRLRLPILLFSAHSATSLRHNIAARVAYIRRALTELPPSERMAYLNDLSFTLSARKEALAYRHAFVFHDGSDLLAQFEQVGGSSTLEIGVKSGGLSSWFDVPELSGFIESVMRNGRWEFLAKCWCEGLDLEWQRYVDFQDCSLVSLPEYRFDEAEYWYPRHSPLVHTAELAGPRTASAAKPVAEQLQLRAPAEQKGRHEGQAATPSVALLRVTETAESPVLSPLATWLSDAIVLVRDGADAPLQVLARRAALAFETRFEHGRLKFHPLGGGTVLDVGELVALCEGRAVPRLLDVPGLVYEFDELLARSEMWIELIKTLRRRPLEVVQWLQSEPMSYAPVLGKLLQGAGFEYSQAHVRSIEVRGQESPGPTLEIPVARGYFILDAKGWSTPAVAQEPAASSAARAIDPEKFYVVAGGTRGLGLEAAKALRARGARRVVLTGIRQLPREDEWIAIMLQPEHPLYRIVFALDQLRQGLTSLDIYVGSLQDEQAVAAFLERAGVRRGNLGGVVYSPGVIDDQNFAFIGKSKESIAAVLAPKLPSLVSFSRVVEGYEPGFFLAFSSISGVFPRLSPAIVDYAAANAFVNYFVESRRRQTRIPYYSICWPSWSDTGMGRVVADSSMASLGIQTIDSAEGVSALERVLQLPPGVYAALKLDGPLDSDLLFRHGESRAPAAVTPAPALVNATNAGVVRHAADAEARVRAIVAETLKMPAPDIQREMLFADMGVESVLMLEIKRKLELAFDLELSSAALIEHATLASLSLHIQSLAGVRGSVAPHRVEPAAPGIREAAVAPAVPARSSGASASAAVLVEPGIELRQPIRPAKVAIVGMAAHLPGASSLGQLWQKLSSGTSCISSHPTREWARHLRDPALPPLRIGEVTLDEPESGSDGQQERDPNAELFVRLVGKALVDAGYDKPAVSGKRASVYVGARSDHSANNIKQYRKSIVPTIGQNFVAAHASYTYNLKGPSLVVDSACSSGAVATHLAVQSLLNGDVDLAICGAVNLLLDERALRALAAEGVLSASGECRAFDESADGFVLGEGGGALVLERLEDAQRAGHKVYAVIEGSAINNNGRGLGITTPDIDANVELIENVLRRCQLDALDLRYVEANGTGVSVSDMVELKALERAYGSRVSGRRRFSLGTLKPNIGHLLTAAGIASLIKCALSLNQRAFCPMLNVRSGSRYFDYQNSALQLNTELSVLSEQECFFAAVNSLGDGGTNAHILLSNHAAPKLELPGGRGEPRAAATVNGDANGESEHVQDSIWY